MTAEQILHISESNVTYKGAKEMYDYRERETFDICEYIRNEVNLSEYSDRDELEEELNDALFCEDSVTGNGSGSYTFNRWTARDYVLDNLDLAKEAYEEFGLGSSEFGEDIWNEEWEKIDVTIRCYLLGECINDALNEMDDVLDF